MVPRGVDCDRYPWCRRRTCWNWSDRVCVGAIEARLHGSRRLLATQEREERSRLHWRAAESWSDGSQSAVRVQQGRVTVRHEHRQRTLHQRLTTPVNRAFVHCVLDRSVGISPLTAGGRDWGRGQSTANRGRVGSGGVDTGCDPTPLGCTECGSGPATVDGVWPIYGRPCTCDVRCLRVALGHFCCLVLHTRVSGLKQSRVTAIIISGCPSDLHTFK